MHSVHVILSPTHVILSEAKDLTALPLGSGMLGYAQRDMATVSAARTRTAGEARIGGLVDTRRMQEIDPGVSPRVPEALCQSSN